MAVNSSFALYFQHVARLLLNLFCANSPVCVFPLLLILPEREHIYRDFLVVFSFFFFNFSNTTVNEEELNFKTDKFLFKSLEK